MLETLLHAVLRLFAFLLRGLLEWWSWGGETETEQWFFYRTACMAVPILTWGCCAWSVTVIRSFWTGAPSPPIRRKWSGRCFGG